MNYYSYPQNYMVNVMKQPTMTFPTHSGPNPFILKALSETLNKSITVYQRLPTHPRPHSSSHSHKEVSTQESKSEKEYAPEKKAEPTKEAYFQIRKEKKREVEKRPDRIPSKPRNQKAPVQPTATQVSPHDKKQEVGLSPRPRVSLSLPNEPRRDLMKARKNSVCPVVPLVDLLDVAYLPSLGFGSKEMKKKRQSLLRRQVLNWQGKQRGRGDRRQLRMLGR